MENKKTSQKEQMNMTPFFTFWKKTEKTQIKKTHFFVKLL